MAEENASNPRQGEPEPQVGDAGLLFRDAQPAGPSSPQPTAAADPGEVFDLVDAPELDTEPTPVQSPSLPPGVQPTAAAAEVPRRERTAAPPADDSRLNPSDLVPEPWSRWAEWGTNLIIVGAWLAVLLIVVYFVFNLEMYGPAFFLLLVGGLVAAVLSYPMLITLERPVRVTPEQAVRDYYAALSHHFPHFRRMWLLLSAAGRISSSFGSFEGYKGYWKEQLARLRQGHAGALTPLVFEANDFNAEKSAGRTRVNATYTLTISVRGQRSAGAIHTIPAALALVRGPDKMWYLESGTLPRAERPAKSSAPS